MSPGSKWLDSGKLRFVRRRCGEFTFDIGPWFGVVDRKVHDYRCAGTEIIASPCSAAPAQVEEFQADGTALG
jgi:hypothetical protein